MFRTKIKKREAEIIKIINSLADCKTPEQKEEKIQAIQKLYALELFDNKQYPQCLKEFIKLKTDPEYIVKLFPELDYDNKEKSKKLTSRDLENALKALMGYLKGLKANVGKSTGQQNEANVALSQQELIDTTLLKCYVQLNYEVTPLLGNNYNCRLEEAEKVLLHHRKHNELIILYQNKGQHLKALQLLKEQAKEPDSRLEVQHKTINYLQQLGAEHLDLIFEFSDWILKENPEKGLNIFTEEKVQVQNLPRTKILDFLSKNHESLIIPYLEHVIITWNEKDSLFHNTLVNCYRDKITDKKANLTDEEVQNIKSKLLVFLEKSLYYNPVEIEKRLPTDSLFEERAIVYGKLGRHKQAIAIFVIILGNVERALRYCENVIRGQKDKSETVDVFVILMKILINPEQESTLMDKSLADVPRHPKTAVPDLETALQIMEKYVDYISPLQALAALPDTVPLDRLKYFLESALDGQLTLKRRLQVVKGLSYAENVQIQDMEQYYESQSVIITESDVCPVCKKRFGNQTAFVRYPNGRVVHFNCRLTK